MVRNESTESTTKLQKMQEQVEQLAASDVWYQQRLAEVQEWEPIFLAFRATLSETQQEQLDSYIAACEELEYSKIYIAYELGKNCNLQRNK